MGLTITIRGSHVDDISTGEAITIDILGAQPFFTYEGVDDTLGHGRFAAIKQFRLAFNIKPREFNVKPSDTEMDTRTYIALILIIRKEFLWIESFSDEVIRMMDATSGLVSIGAISLPMEVDLRDISEPTPNFEEGTDEVDSIVLCGRDWY